MPSTNPVGPPASQRWAFGLAALLGYVCLLFGFTAVGQSLGSALTESLYGVSAESVLASPDDYSPDRARAVLLASAGFGLGISFLLFPLIYFRLVPRAAVGLLPLTRNLKWQALGLALLALALSMPLILWIWELNQSFKLGGALGEQLRALTELYERQVELLTSFPTVGHFLIGAFVIALIPAVGEELMFRGLIQRGLTKYWHPQVAIWVTAIIFSAVHLDFAGFFPRLLLGAFFGYLLLWSGNILFPMAAHFLNNFLSLLIAYLAPESILNDPQAPVGQGTVIWVPLFSGLVVFLLLRQARGYLPPNPRIR